MSWGTKIYTWLYGNLVGKDEFGNLYYSSLKDFSDKNARRWVIYNGIIEATKIPPHWHAWLHKSIDAPPLKYSHKYDLKGEKRHETLIQQYLLNDDTEFSEKPILWIHVDHEISRNNRKSLTT